MFSEPKFILYLMLSSEDTNLFPVGVLTSVDQ